jgi:succinate dehydrogenase / fumarate reductase cytochrome b subunit
MGTITRDHAHYFLLKIHSLLGLVPIGLFLVVHFSINSLRTVGVLPYQLSIDLINNLPFLIWIEIGFIYTPLLLHSLIGFYISGAAKINVHRYNYTRNWMYLLQRLTGGVVFVFLVYHIATTAGAKLWFGHHRFEAAPFLIDIMNEEFQTWTGRVVYLIGILSATFHFANGLWAFCISWGILIGPRAQKYAGWGFMLVGIVLSVMAIATVVEFSLHPIPVQATLKETG